MKKMLFNAAHTEEIRVAIVDGRSLADLILEHTVQDQKKANIYKGKITRIEPSLEAAFVNYGQDRHGFLPLKEVAQAYRENESHEVERLKIQDALKEGQEILVQVDKEERGNKGAALSTFISLAGSYLVLIPNNPHAGGISRRIEGEERDQLRSTLAEVNIPEKMGVIVRTAGIGKSPEELQWDLDYLMSLWHAISKVGEQLSAPCLIHQESDVCIRTIRDHLRDDIDEVWVDDETVFNKVKKHVEMVRPDLANRVKLYTDSTPLFTRHQVESQIEQVFSREVRLPSGGSIVIDRTEALIAIDINSAQSTKGGDIEETAYHTNLEAAEEIAKQLRLRDLGGLIVIDFIDMTPLQNQRDVENRLRDATSQDRARIQLGRISRFGMLEMSRQRLRSALAESTQVVCPRCHGRGTIRSVESVAISILRNIEENASKPSTQAVHAHVPVDVATYILNEKRADLLSIEERQHSHILILPTQSLESPHHHINRIRGEKTTNTVSSHEIKLEEILEKPDYLDRPVNRETAVLKDVMPQTPAPKPGERRQPSQQRRKPHHKQKPEGLLGAIKRLFGMEEKPEPKKPARHRQSGQNRRGQQSSKPRRNNSKSGQGRTQASGNNENRENRSENRDNRSNRSQGQGQGQQRRRNSQGNRSNQYRRRGNNRSGNAATPRNDDVKPQNADDKNLNTPVAQQEAPKPQTKPVVAAPKPKAEKPAAAAPAKVEKADTTPKAKDKPAKTEAKPKPAAPKKPIINDEGFVQVETKRD